MADYKTFSGNVPQPIKDSIEQVLTFVEYIDGTTAQYNIVGELKASSIPNRTDIAKVRIGKNVTTLKYNAFYYCSNLSSVEIPNSVDTIERLAFLGCTSLEQISLPSKLTTIELSLFDGCSRLSNVSIPSNVTVIKDGAFHNCSQLRNIAIPKNVTTIEDRAFVDCSSLETVTFNGNKPSIGANAFPSTCAFVVDYNSDWKSSAEIPGTFDGHQIKFSEKTIATYESSTEFAEETRQFSLGKCLADAMQMSYLRYSSSTLTWDNFFSSASYIDIKPSFASILGSSISKISLYLTEFSGYLVIRQNGTIVGSSKHSIQTPVHGTSLYKTTFEFDLPVQILTDISLQLYLSPVSLQEETPQTYEISVRSNDGGSSAFKISSDSPRFPTLFISYKTQAKKQFKVEYDVIDGDDFSAISQEVDDCSIVELSLSHNITSIPDGAFQNYTTLRKAILANSISTIGINAFKACNQLTSMILRYGVTSIGTEAFSGCKGLTSIMIPDSVTTIGEKIFYGCSGLTSVMIPDSVTSIGNYTFFYCTNLTSATISNSVTSIGKETFKDCSELTSVMIGNRVTTISDGAFYGCNKLTDVTIPDSVTDIKKQAFYYCRGLTNMTIPNNVTSIGDQAFYNCNTLTSIEFEGNVPTVGTNAFAGVASGCKAIINPAKEGWPANGESWKNLTIEYKSA